MLFPVGFLWGRGRCWWERESKYQRPKGAIVAAWPSSWWLCGEGRTPGWEGNPELRMDMAIYFIGTGFIVEKGKLPTILLNIKSEERRELANTTGLEIHGSILWRTWHVKWYSITSEAKDLHQESHCCATLLREERVDCRHYMKDASETFVWALFVLEALWEKFETWRQRPLHELQDHWTSAAACSHGSMVEW